MASNRVSPPSLHTASHPERRSFGRRRPVWHAWIIASSLQRLTCCVRNVSNGGALLELPVPEWLPAEFDVLIEGADMRLACEVVHRGKHGVGVHFTDGERAADLIAYCHGRMEERQAVNGGFQPPRLTSDLIKQVLRRA